MKPTIRIPRELLDHVKADLSLQHPFAAERIGFLHAKIANSGNEKLLILVNDYSSVCDEDYVDDKYSGARINSNCIRREMQRILDTGIGTFHVHMHDHRGIPRMSEMDRREIPKLVQSFKTVGPSGAHGIFLLSRDSCWAAATLPQTRDWEYELPISIIGFPITFFGRG